MVEAVALIAALSFGMTRASGLSLGAGSDLGPQVMMRLFGENSDATASFAAAQGDRISESPFRDLALQMKPPGAAPGFAAGLDRQYAQARLTLPQLYSDRGAFVPGTNLHDIVDFVSPTTFFSAQYQPVAPIPNISPEPGTLAFAPPSYSGQTDQRATDTASPLNVAPSTQLGSVRFEGHTETAAQTPQLDLHDTTYGAGANFNVRAGKRNLSVNLSSGYDQVAAGGGNGFSASTLSSSSWQVPGGIPLVVPNDAGLNRLSVGAGVAVPVMHGLTLNLNYAAQHLYNGYGLPGLQNLDTVNNTYGGRLTFNIPDTSSSLSISAYQDRFQDSLLPINGSTQTREDVNFTVKF